MRVGAASIAVFATLLSVSVVGRAQAPAPPGADLTVFAARRFPQPVRVGDLINRVVLRPIESRAVLGHVLQVVRLGSGRVEVVVNYGGVFGWRARPIAVPIEAMVLLGNELEILDFTPRQLEAFPSYLDNGDALAADEMVRMGLAHPSH